MDGDIKTRVIESNHNRSAQITEIAGDPVILYLPSDPHLVH